MLQSTTGRKPDEPGRATRMAGKAPTVSDLVSSIRGTFRRRIGLMLLVAGLLFAGALVFISLLTPQYEAATRIRIDPSRNPLAGPADQGVAGLNSETIETEVSVMSSLDLARDVVRRLNLDRDPEFMPKEDSERRPLSDAERLNVVARNVMRHLSVDRDKLSYIISVTVKAGEPQKAARIANAFADSYLALRVGSQVGTAERQAAFFRQRLEELGKEVNAAGERLAAYRARTGITESGSAGTIVDQQVAPLSTQLATAEADAASARSKAAVAQAQIAHGVLDSVSEVRSSTVIADLRRQRAEIVRNMGEVESRYGAKHPETIRVTQQLAAIDKQIQDEAQRVVRSLQADAASASAQVASLRGAMAQLQGERSQNARASAVADNLQRDYDAKRAGYQRMSDLSLQSTQSTRNSIAQAEIVERAEPPSGPSAPKKPLLIALALVASLAVGFAVGVAQEVLQGGLRTIGDVEEGFGLPVLATVPNDRRGRGLLRRRSTVSPAERLVDAPATPFAEALRTARASLMGADPTTAPRVIAFASALPGEGKTTTALAFARICAMNDFPTLLIDGDLRRAGLRRAIGATVDNGPAEVLSGQVQPEAAIIADRVPKLDMLIGREPFFTPKDIFAEPAMRQLLAWAKTRYQTIILDLPPVLGVADARTLAMLADATVLVVKWGATPPQAVDLALSSLQSDGSRVAGAILTMVNPSAEAVGGTYYSGKYTDYYQRG